MFWFSCQNLDAVLACVRLQSRQFHSWFFVDDMSSKNRQENSAFYWKKRYRTRRHFYLFAEALAKRSSLQRERKFRRRIEISVAVRRSSEVSSSKDHDYKADVSSAAGPSTPKTEEQGKKSRMNLPLLNVLWCAVQLCSTGQRTLLLLLLLFSSWVGFNSVISYDRTCGTKACGSS